MSKPTLKYISKRLVARKSSVAFQEGAKKAMEANGYVIVALDGWVDKKFADRKIERLEELDSELEEQNLIFD